MRVRLAVVSVVTAAVLPAVPSSADHPVDGPLGLPCRFLTTGEGTGYVAGGPYLASGTVTCTVSGGTPSSTSATGTGVVVVAPTPVSVTPWLAPLTGVCTSFTPTGGDTLYWHSTVISGVGHWSDRSWGFAECGLSANTDVPTADDVYDLLYCCDEDLYDRAGCEFFYLLVPLPDAVVSVDPEDGDLHLAGEPFWDCPPYDLWWG